MGKALRFLIFLPVFLVLLVLTPYWFIYKKFEILNAEFYLFVNEFYLRDNNDISCKIAHNYISLCIEEILITG